MTIRWADENIDKWLTDLNPEIALIMFGTNDLNSVPLNEYTRKTEDVVRKCLDNGTVVILSTIPPRRGFAQKASEYADAVRQIARDTKVPLIDFHAEILKRRPEDWDGAADKFARYEGYDVPTLLARDGVHPSHPTQYRDDYSPEALRSCGFSLRNYLVLAKYAEVLVKLGLVTPGPGETPVSAESHTVSIAIEELISQDWFPKAPPLPAPTGPTVRVSDVSQLIAAIENAKPGETVLVEDGHYFMPRYVAIAADNVTLRGASGHRDRVVIDGAKSKHGELIGITACRGVTIADLTIQNIRYNGFKINSDSNVQDLTIYNCVIHNIWQRGVKGVKVLKARRPHECPKNCRVQYCLFYNDRPKRLEDDPGDIAGGNYVGGIDVMYAHNWVISDNVFIGIQGRTREARGAVFIWHEARDCIVERNIIIDCDVGIAFGNSHKLDETPFHCAGCIARNNFITRCPESGIVADYTRRCRILHNTIHDPTNRLRRLLRFVHDNPGLLVANNLLSGPGFRDESDDPVELADNMLGLYAAAFADPARGDLHLRQPLAAFVDKARPTPDVTDDIDHDHRDSKPDIGADESSP